MTRLKSDPPTELASFEMPNQLPRGQDSTKPSSSGLETATRNRMLRSNMAHPYHRTMSTALILEDHASSRVPLADPHQPHRLP